MSTRRRRGLSVGVVFVCMAFFVTLTGCVGYVAPAPPGPWGGAGVVVVPPPPPSVVVWGSPFDRGPAVRAYSHRGFQSRAAVHGGGRSGGGFHGGWH